MSLFGKSFVVTGAASGIGLATVQKLLQHSATVHAIDKSESIPTVHDSGGKLWVYPAVDVSCRTSVNKTFRDISERSPKLSGLVNCAGIVKQHKSSTSDDDVFKQVLDVNLVGTWNVSTEFVHVVQATKKTSPAIEADVSIVNIGSTASFRGMPGIPGYVASKHAVLGLTRAWAQEWGSLGIRVNLVGPGVIRTAMTQPEGSADTDSMVTFPTALNKPFAEPEEIARTIIFFLSDASSYVTGQGLEANGGWL